MWVRLPQVTFALVVATSLLVGGMTLLAGTPLLGVLVRVCSSVVILGALGWLLNRVLLFPEGAPKKGTPIDLVISEETEESLE